MKLQSMKAQPLATPYRSASQLQFPGRATNPRYAALLSQLSLSFKGISKKAFDDHPWRKMIYWPSSRLPYLEQVHSESNFWWRSENSSSQAFLPFAPWKLVHQRAVFAFENTEKMRELPNWVHFRNSSWQSADPESNLYSDGLFRGTLYTGLNLFMTCFRQEYSRRGMAHNH